MKPVDTADIFQKIILSYPSIRYQNR